MRHETKLRRAVPLRSKLLKHLADFQIHIRIGNRVGRVEDQRIDPRVVEHRAMPPDHILAVGHIISQFGFPPVMKCPRRPPLRVLRIGRQKLRDVERPRLPVLPEPQEIKNPHRPVRPRLAAFGPRCQRPAQPVGRHPGVAVQIPRRLRRQSRNQRKAPRRYANPFVCFHPAHAIINRRPCPLPQNQTCPKPLHQVSYSVPLAHSPAENTAKRF